MKKHSLKENLPKLGKNNKRSWHLNQDLLPPSSSPPAQLNRNYTLEAQPKLQSFLSPSVPNQGLCLTGRLGHQNFLPSPN